MLFAVRLFRSMYALVLEKMLNVDGIHGTGLFVLVSEREVKECLRNLAVIGRCFRSLSYKELC